MGCTGGSYRTIVRPTYKQAYKTVTALEWKCCPGHTGANCEAGMGPQIKTGAALFKEIMFPVLPNFNL
uniref:EMI domain-containing protein 1 n=1 Tax=Sphaerodactylus townsendi TaxID=933632 RepID=A0ACB8FZQ8_9SAUR